jgi:nicotinamide mononucleotide transporter
LLENWLVWMTADIIYILLYCYKALYLTGFLYAFFFGLCIAGYQSWLKSIKSAPQEVEAIR